MKKLALVNMFIWIMIGMNNFLFSQGIEDLNIGFSKTFRSLKFDNKIPADCPFKKGNEIEEIEFTGRYANYTNADTWYPTWAGNDTLYSPWTDGYIFRTDKYEPYRKDHPGYASFSLDYLGRKASTSQAAIAGSDPLNLQITNIMPSIEASPKPYGGRYPCGSLLHNNIWYYGTYCVTENKKSKCNSVGWTELGPFVGFRISRDFGKSWIETRLRPDSSLFNEKPDILKVKIGSPHFVDFGKNMMYSPDGYAYLTAHGSTDTNSCNGWIQGDEIYLIRVKPEPETINDIKSYKFFAGYDVNNFPVWSGSFKDIKPLLKWKEHLGCVTVTYNPYLKKYFMCITRGVENTMFLRRYDTMILLADSLTGTWRINCYWESFGPVAYFVNIPSKFISTGGKTMWLTYSANWDNKNVNAFCGTPEGSYYSLSLHELKINKTKIHMKE